MQRFKHSLAFRIVIACGAIGVVISAVFAAAVYVATQVIEDTLVVELLAEETAKFEGETPFSHTMPYRMHGYYGRRTEMPSWLAELPVGFSETRDPRGVEQHVFVREVGPRIAVATQDATLVEDRQQQIGILLLIFALVGAYLSVWVGWLLSRHVIAPLQRLASEVASLPSTADAGPLAARYPRDELGALARAVDEYRLQLAAAMQRERDFSADASHELRTPLTIIRGAVEVLRQTPGMHQAAEVRLARIERAADEMHELIDSFLLLARNQSQDAEEVNLCSLILASIQAERAANPDPRVSVDADVPASAWVHAPPHVLTSVCGNLVRNAMRHAPGPIVVRLLGTRFEVQDAGDSAMEFSPGRGLSIVERLCRQYGWGFSIERHGDGTRAFIDFGADLTLS